VVKMRVSGNWNQRRALALRAGLEIAPKSD
jgi:hypothetical protein